MISRDKGLHLRAQVKDGGRRKNEEHKVSWDKVNSFSLSALRGIANENGFRHSMRPPSGQVQPSLGHAHFQAQSTG